MADAILDTVTAALADAGINAYRVFPEDFFSKEAGPAAVVTMKQNKLLSSGSGEYLGEKTVGGVTSEVYGFRMESVIYVAVYSPDDGINGASGCERLCDAIADAIASLPSGLKLRAVVRGETKYDKHTECFTCGVELHCAAFLTREENTDTGAFTDFILRGVLTN